MSNKQRMTRIRRIVTCFLLLTPHLSPLTSAQTAFDIIELNRSFAASNYSIYPDTVLPSLTPAPQGKTPFYISHYGRHGSRYIENRKGFDIPYKMLCKADSMKTGSESVLCSRETHSCHGI